MFAVTVYEKSGGPFWPSITHLSQSHYCMPHTLTYVRSILNSTAAAGGFPDLAPWHTHRARYPSHPHWTITHRLVVEYPWKHVQCSKSLLKKECT